MPIGVSVATDVAVNLRADVYFYMLMSQREQVKQFIWVLNVCVCEREQEIAHRQASLFHAWLGSTISTTLTVRADGEDLPHEETFQHTLSWTWCATQGPPQCPLTCLSVQQWVTFSILSLQVSVWMRPAACINKSPEVSKLNHGTRCSLQGTRHPVPALQSKQQLLFPPQLQTYDSATLSQPVIKARCYYWFFSSVVMIIDEKSATSLTLKKMLVFMWRWDH